MIAPVKKQQKLGGEVKYAGLNFLAKMSSLDAEMEEVQAWMIEQTRQILDAKSMMMPSLNR